MAVKYVTSPYLENFGWTTRGRLDEVLLWVLSHKLARLDVRSCRH